MNNTGGWRVEGGWWTSHCVVADPNNALVHVYRWRHSKVTLLFIAPASHTSTVLWYSVGYSTGAIFARTRHHMLTCLQQACTYRLLESRPFLLTNTHRHTHGFVFAVLPLEEWDLNNRCAPAASRMHFLSASPLINKQFRIQMCVAVATSSPACSDNTFLPPALSLSAPIPVSRWVRESPSRLAKRDRVFFFVVETPQARRAARLWASEGRKVSWKLFVWSWRWRRFSLRSGGHS